MSKKTNIDKKVGTCELCGGHRRELRVLAAADFIGWACEECRKQLWESAARRYCGTIEETEPAE